MKKLILMVSILVFSSGAVAQEASTHDGYWPVPDQFIISKGASGIEWDYTFTTPTSTDLQAWVQPGYDSSAWAKSKGGYYRGTTEPEDELTTSWLTTHITLRADINLTQDQINNMMFWGRWDDNITVYINGAEAFEYKGWTKAYRYYGMPTAVRNAMSPGINTIAVHVERSRGAAFFDMGIAYSPEMANPPVSGYSANADLNSITEYAREKMSQYGVPAGVIAVGRTDLSTGEKMVVLSKGIGFMDKQFERPVPNDAIFRLASLDKMPAIASLRLMMIGEDKSEGTYSVGGKTYPIFGCDMGANLANPMAVVNPATGSLLRCDDSVLDILVHFGVVGLADIVDSRMHEIRIVDILHYQGFLQKRPDLLDTHGANQYYSSLGVTSNTSTPADMMRWYFTQNLNSKRASQIYSLYNSDDPAVVRYLIGVLHPGLLDFLRSSLLDSSPYKDIFIANYELDQRVHALDGSLREPWYITFWGEFGFPSALGDALALSASAETYAMFKETYGYGLNYGSMRGSDTVTVENGSSNYHFSLSWFVNGQKLIPFGGGMIHSPESVDITAQKMLEDLPASSWVATQNHKDCKTMADNIVPNCTYDIPTATNWNVLVHGGANGFGSYRGEELRVDISSPGSEHWHVQAVTPINLLQGKYSLKFVASAESPREIVINVGHDGSADSNWTSYYQQAMKIDATQKEYELTIMDLPYDMNARLDFNLGANGASDVVLDNISLIKH